MKINGISYTAATAARGTDTKTLVVTLPTGAKAIDQDDVVTLSYSGTNLADGVGNVYAGFLKRSPSARQQRRAAMQRRLRERHQRQMVSR